MIFQEQEQVQFQEQTQLQVQVQKQFQNNKMKNYLLIIGLLISNFIIAQEIEITKSNSLAKNSNEKTKSNFSKILPNPYNWTNDFEAIFSKDEEAKLNQIIADFEKETTVEITIITIDSLNVSKEKFDELSLQIARTWGIGKKEKSNGILIAISKGHRQIRIQNGDGIVPILSNEETSEIIQNVIIPFFKKENYFEGTQSGLLKIIELLKKRLK
jgi:uncharacterized protein